MEKEENIEEKTKEDPLDEVELKEEDEAEDEKSDESDDKEDEPKLSDIGRLKLGVATARKQGWSTKEAKSAHKEKRLDDKLDIDWRSASSGDSSSYRPARRESRERENRDDEFFYSGKKNESKSAYSEGAKNNYDEGSLPEIYSGKKSSSEFYDTGELKESGNKDSQTDYSGARDIRTYEQIVEDRRSGDTGIDGLTRKIDKKKLY